MTGSDKPLPHYTCDDYVQWEGRWELIAGVPYAMPPVPSPRHQYLANTLGALFYNALKTCTTCQAYPFLHYKVAEDTVLQPDLSVLCRPATGKWIDFTPAIVAEIVAPSTLQKDRFTKQSIYELQLIPYCLFVYPEKEETEIHVLQENKYLVKEKARDFTYTFHLPDACSIAIDFAELWK